MKRNSGQALVIVLLSLAVVLTLVLSILSRSITDIAVSTNDESAVRAFSAAEAGIEKSLIVGTSLGSTQVGDATYTTTVVGAAEGADYFILPSNLGAGGTATFWLVGHDDNGNISCVGESCFVGNTLKICWGDPDAVGSTPPAVEISIYYAEIPGNYSTVKIARVTADPDNVRRAGNNFGNAETGACNNIGGNDYVYGKTTTLSSLGVPIIPRTTPGGLLFAKVGMLYNTDQKQPLAIDIAGSGGNLPAQGLSITSTGISGDSNRRIQVFQSWPETATSFGFALYSTTGIVKY